MGAYGKTINIFEVSGFRSSLLEDLSFTGPAGLDIAGCTYNGNRIATVVSRPRPPHHLSLRRSIGSPPRGEMDLWECNADLVIRDQMLESNLSLAQHGAAKWHGHAALIPVRANEADLAAVRDFAASTVFAPPPWAFVVLNVGQEVGPYIDALIELGHVVPGEFGFRAVDPHAYREGPVEISEAGIAEGRALWAWLSEHAGPFERYSG